jgi:uroporphyrinogen decarboxylase
MDSLKDRGVPRIYFLKGNASYLDLIKQVDCEAMGVDWTLDLSDAIEVLPDYAVQGNLDPLVLYGDHAQIRERALEICRKGTAARGHVFNLGHGILPQAPIAAVETLVETVQGFRR